jgi:DNA-binding CsgD family transcriptional regulator
MAHQKSLENERLHSSLYALAALLVLIIAVGIAIFKRIQTKKEQAIRSINATYYNKMAVYNQLQKDFYRLVEQESVNKELLDKIRTELEEKERELAKYTAAEQLRALADDLDNPLLQALHQKAAIGCKALKKDKEELGRLLSADYIKLHSLLMEKSAMLSEEEYMVCVLVRFNFIPSEISSLLNLSSQTVTNIRTRLLKKLFGVSGGAKDFDQALVEYR